MYYYYLFFNSVDIFFCLRNSIFYPRLKLLWRSRVEEETITNLNIKLRASILSLTREKEGSVQLNFRYRKQLNVFFMDKNDFKLRVLECKDASRLRRLHACFFSKNHFIELFPVWCFHALKKHIIELYFIDYYLNLS